MPGVWWVRKTLHMTTKHVGVIRTARRKLGADCTSDSKALRWILNEFERQNPEWFPKKEKKDQTP